MVTAVSVESIAGLVPKSISPAGPLPDQVRALDAARFEQLLQQAQNEQARVEFTNPASSKLAPGLNSVMRGVESSSNDYLGTVDKGLKSLSSLDLTDPKSVTNAISTFTVMQIQGVQLTAVIGEVSNSKKSLQTLFQQQG